MKPPNTKLRDNEVDDAFGVDYLQDRIDREFPLARHIRVSVDRAHDGGVVLRAPFAPNSNHKQTAFGGSLFCVAVLSGWGWATRYLAARGLDADAVIQESTMRYLKPVKGEFQGALKAPPPDQLERFLKMLARSGRGRLRLHVEIHDGQTLAARFDGVFVAVLRSGAQSAVRR
ncbi:MAG: YiiD C-terminal domain-containing protein [Steroidobacteraceae bacterium]|jgi:thioesterase domain-containing protein